MVSGVKVVVILSLIETEEETAAVIELVVHFGVDIIEVIVVFISIIIVFVHYEIFEEGGMGSPRAEAERSVPLPDGTFNMQLVGECADAERTVVMVHISVVGAHVDDGGKAASVTGGKGTLVECGVFHCFGGENREYTQQMVCIIYRKTVQ